MPSINEQVASLQQQVEALTKQVAALAAHPKHESPVESRQHDKVKEIGINRFRNLRSKA